MLLLNAIVFNADWEITSAVREAIGLGALLAGAKLNDEVELREKIRPYVSAWRRLSSALAMNEYSSSPACLGLNAIMIHDKARKVPEPR